MRASEVYLRAAEGLFRYKLPPQYGCCDWINFLSDRPDKATEFTALFHPDAVRRVYWGDQWSADPAERKACRVLALCLMAAIAEDDE